MVIHFSKYQGAGNDFIIIDGRQSNPFNSLSYPANVISSLCHRRFGVGADGMIILSESNRAEFEMEYYNSDGKKGSFCGNGGRCIVAYAYHLGLVNKQATFGATDGLHTATITPAGKSAVIVSLGLNDVDKVSYFGDDLFLDTGSPHYIRFVADPNEIDVVKEGRLVRYSDQFAPGGTNVNFARVKNGIIEVRTYERGVEDETLACGTGITATAIAAYIKGLAVDNNRYQINAKGGRLVVNFQHMGQSLFRNIKLEGPAIKVFEGVIITG